MAFHSMCLRDVIRRRPRQHAGSIRFRLLRWVSAASLLGAVAVTAHGQDQVADDTQRTPPTFRTNVNYVRVDVFVTRDGEPVTDLRPDEFQILDEGVRQEITQFEYISIRGNVPQAARTEPSTVAESREMLQDPRARVFVLFLDRRHVDAAASRTISQPLVEMLEELVGVDDLIGVMTPDMSATDVTFGRKTVALRRLLAQEWWGERNRLVTTDPAEEQYRVCYPPPPGSGRMESRLASELIERRREKMTLDALGDLVRYLHGAREGRKAVLAITEGWRLFGPTMDLLRQDRPDAPQADPGTLVLPPVGFDPVAGTLGTRPHDAFRSACERDRQMLARTDNDARFRRMLDEANRANVSFYPVDPRGLTPYDAPIGPGRAPSLEVDRARLRDRLLSLRTLADLTDGLAVVNTNNINEGLERVVEHLSSYYLLGYYASGVETDGTFHDVSVRVSRPGVAVRARRGYLAASREEMLAAVPAIDPGSGPSPTAVARARALERALGSLAGLSREMPLRLQVAAGWATVGAATFHVVGEFGQDDEWAAGAQVDVILSTPNDETLSTGRASVEAGTRRFEIALRAADPVTPGNYAVRVRARGRAAGSLPASDVVTVSLPAAPDGTGARFFRRGPATGKREVATADLRFRRREHVRIDVPGQEGSVPSATLLDRTGATLGVPVETAVRDAGDGTWWVTAEVVLAPLAPGDYVIEISGVGPSHEPRETRQVWSAFRVVP